MTDVMDRWMRESMSALENMEARLAEHENAVEAAMTAIRRHTEEIERLESSVRIVREALGSALEQAEATAPASPAPEVETVRTNAAMPRQAVGAPPPPPPPKPVLRAIPGQQQPPHWQR